MMDSFGAAWSSTGTAWQVAWQTTVVLALGVTASRIVPMRPSRSHRILLASALACLILLPAALAARWLDFGLLSPRRASVAVTSAGVLSAAPESGPKVERVATASPSRPFPARTASVPTGAEVEARVVPQLPRVPLALLIPIAWVIVVAAGLLRLVASFAGSLRLMTGATILRDPSIVAAAAAAARSLGLSAAPEVRKSASVRCPVVWCWGRRPVLILPLGLASGRLGSTSDWSAVLCHELAHWKRADHVAGFISELLTCVFPWQPLAWMVRGRMAGLSELACDDWALAHARTVTPHDYAEVLLGLALERRRPLVPAAVSRPSGLRVRIRHILEQGEPRPRTGIVWSALVAGLAIGLVAVLALARTRQARAVLAEPPAAEAAGDGKRTAIEGTVRGRNGEPLAGVDVYWAGIKVTPLTHATMPRDDPDYGKQFVKLLARGTTDDRGHFRLDAALEKPLVDEPWTMVLAHKKGLAPTGAELDLDGKPIDLRLEPAVRIAGRLLGPGGDPAPGVIVRLEDYTEGSGGDSKGERKMRFSGDQVWDTRPAFYANDVRTDTDGRFILDGFVPEGVFAKLILTSPDFAVEQITVSTGASTQPTPELAAFSIRPLPRDFTHTLAPARPVVGRITDAETKAPLGGVTVKVIPMREHGGMQVSTVTDADGRYRVSDREGDEYWVTAYPTAGSGYRAAQRGSIRWQEGESELRVDLALQRGVVLRGRVLDEDTGKPVPYVSVAYQPRRGNSHVRDEDEFRSPALTNASGEFALTGLTGPGVVVAEAPPGDYLRRKVDPIDFGYVSSLHVHGLARIDAANGPPPQILIKIKRGFTLRARTVRPDGTVPDVVDAWCPELTSRLFDNGVWLSEFAGSAFELRGAEPGRTYRIFFLDGNHKFGAVAELKADPERKEPAVVRLLPTAALRGRVLDKDGTPIVGAQVLPNIQLVDKGGVLSERDRFDGLITQVYAQFTNEPLKRVHPAEFRYEGLIPGVRYFVSWYTRDNEHFWHAVEPVQPGEDRDVGDIRADRKGGKDGN